MELLNVGTGTAGTRVVARDSSSAVVGGVGLHRRGSRSTQMAEALALKLGLELAKKKGMEEKCSWNWILN